MYINPSRQSCWEVNPKLWEKFILVRGKFSTSTNKYEIFTEDFCVQWLDLNYFSSIDNLEELNEII